MPTGKQASRDTKQIDTHFRTTFGNVKKSMHK